jgi:hypothetical protein
MPETKKVIHTRIGEFLRDELISNVHYWEGKKTGSHMRDEIKLEVADESHAVVGVRKEYAQIENSRPGSKSGYGPHNFADISLQTTETEGLKIAKEEYDKLFGL